MCFWRSCVLRVFSSLPRLKNISAALTQHAMVLCKNKISLPHRTRHAIYRNANSGFPCFKRPQGKVYLCYKCVSENHFDNTVLSKELKKSLTTRVTGNFVITGASLIFVAGNDPSFTDGCAGTVLRHHCLLLQVQQKIDTIWMIHLIHGMWTSMIWFLLANSESLLLMCVCNCCSRKVQIARLACIAHLFWTTADPAPSQQ